MKNGNPNGFPFFFVILTDGLPEMFYGYHMWKFVVFLWS